MVQIQFLVCYKISFYSEWYTVHGNLRVMCKIHDFLLEWMMSFAVVKTIEMASNPEIPNHISQ